MNPRWICVFLCCFCFAGNPLFAKYNYNISVTAIFQNEARFIKEWIEYYKLLGVEHFYLYNNLSDDDYLTVLSPYIQKGEVELIEWNYVSHNLSEWDKIQIDAYADAIKRTRNTSKWLLIIDIDEFVVPLTAKDLKSLLSPYGKDKKIGGVCIPWVFFGTSHYYEIPKDKLMIEALTLNGGKAANGDIGKVWQQGAYKSIVRPKYVNNAASPHYCGYSKGRRHQMIEKKAQINHYWTRDEKFLLEDKIPRRVHWGQKVDSVLLWAEGMNQETPQGKPILRFVPELRKRLGLNL